VLYPSLDEVENNIAPAGALRPVIGEKAEILEVLSLPQWNAQCYDDGLHPGAMGRHVLAEAISATLLNQQAQARLQSAQV
jgi:lysophospholipase L1-like esterase